MSKKRPIVPGGVTEYIAACPKDVQPILKSIRMTIRKAVPGAVETVSYFKFPGYHYPGYDAYNGMFAWFSYKKPYVRLHLWPAVIKAHKKELEGCVISTGAINFPPEKKISLPLVRKLVKASFKELKERST